MNRFKFIRNEKNFPVACLATNVDRVNGSVTYAVSIWNPKDTFSKKLAREIALSRLEKRPHKLDVQSPSSCHEIMKLVMRDMLTRKDLFANNTKGLPKHVSTLVAEWLNKA